ncbi:MAG: putative membrane protein YfcA [Glaciecola sp.]|jgi:uncharacterized membrane protein YfcA
MIFDPAIWVGAILMGLSLGLLGSGGSILTVPLLVYIAHEPEKMAIAESLMIVGLVALTGSISQFMKRLVDMRLVVIFGLPSMFAAYLGAYLSQFMGAQIQMLVFSVVMLGASVFMLKPLKAPENSEGTQNEKTNSHLSSSQYLVLVVAGMCVGTLAGLVGVGGGFLIVPALLLIAKTTMRKAIATSLFIIAMQSFAGFAKYSYLLNTQELTFNLPLMFLVTACAIVGVLVGGMIVNKLPQARLKQFFGVALIPLSLFILFSNV